MTHGAWALTVVVIGILSIFALVGASAYIEYHRERETEHIPVEVDR